MYVSKTLQIQAHILSKFFRKQLQNQGHILTERIRIGRFCLYYGHIPKYTCWIKSGYIRAQHDQSPEIGCATYLASGNWIHTECKFLISDLLQIQIQEITCFRYKNAIRMSASGFARES